MTNKIYDILSFVGKLLMPALATLIVTIWKIWLPSSELGTMIGATIMALDTFLNACLGISSINYYAEKGKDNE